MISFENTEIAFAYKNDKELKSAKFLFSIMGNSFLVNLGLKLLPSAIKNKIPFTKIVLNNTIFPQFVGGETLEETAPVVKKLAKYNVQVIMDYGVEGGHNGEEGFDEATEEFIKVIDYIGSQPHIPFMSIKITGIARFALLEKIDKQMNNGEATLVKRYRSTIDLLDEKEKAEWNKVVLRIFKICENAKKKNVGVLIDAEESWIQDPVDALTMLMMDTFNQNKPVVYNTLQMYRHDRIKFLEESFEAATDRKFMLGLKIVRGAYMEKERERAKELGYPSPIQKDKISCDKDYDLAIKLCVEKVNFVSFIVASHNENSNLLATQLMEKHGLKNDHPNIYFSQLYGMSDQITFNLAKENYRVSKYLPFGPIKDVIPYLMRRAEENSSVSGQTGRELSLIKKELKRRKA
ncbi:MAG: proline dehydrogenase family protein [Ferruginibacter sp.]